MNNFSKNGQIFCLFVCFLTKIDETNKSKQQNLIQNDRQAKWAKQGETQRTGYLHMLKIIASIYVLSKISEHTELLYQQAHSGYELVLFLTAVF